MKRHEPWFLVMFWAGVSHSLGLVLSLGSQTAACISQVHPSEAPWVEAQRSRVWGPLLVGSVAVT